MVVVGRMVREKSKKWMNLQYVLDCAALATGLDKG